MYVAVLRQAIWSSIFKSSPIHEPGTDNGIILCSLSPPSLEFVIIIIFLVLLLIIHRLSAICNHFPHPWYKF
jgi:hypothetical protein